MKVDYVSIKFGENGCEVTVEIQNPEGKDRWDTIQKTYYFSKASQGVSFMKKFLVEYLKSTKEEKVTE